MSFWRILLMMLLVVLALFCVGIAIAHSGERLAMKLDPSACQAPCTTEVILDVPPDPANHAIVVEISGETYYTSSSAEVKQAKRYIFTYTRIPVGDYFVRAFLYDSVDRPVDRTTRQLVVR